MEKATSSMQNAYLLKKDKQHTEKSDFIVNVYREVAQKILSTNQKVHILVQESNPEQKYVYTEEQVIPLVEDQCEYYSYTNYFKENYLYQKPYTEVLSQKDPEILHKVSQFISFIQRIHCEKLMYAVFSFPSESSSQGGEAKKRVHADTTEKVGRKKKWPETIEGWVEYAKKESFFGKTPGEFQSVRNSHAHYFYKAFRNWLSQFDEKIKNELALQVINYKGTKYPNTIEGWITFSQDAGYFGKTPGELQSSTDTQEIHFYKMFAQWLNLQPSTLRDTLFLQVLTYKKSKYPNTIEAWIEYAKEENFYKKTPGELQAVQSSQGAYFYKAFRQWLNTVPKEQHKSYERRVLSYYNSTKNRKNNGWGYKFFKEHGWESVPATKEEWARFSTEQGYRQYSLQELFNDKVKDGKKFYTQFILWVAQFPDEEQAAIKNEMFAAHNRSFTIPQTKEEWRMVSIKLRCAGKKLEDLLQNGNEQQKEFAQYLKSYLVFQKNSKFIVRDYILGSEK